MRVHTAPIKANWEISIKLQNSFTIAPETSFHKTYSYTCLYLFKIFTRLFTRGLFQKPKIISTQVVVYEDVVKYGSSTTEHYQAARKRCRNCSSLVYITPKLSDVKQQLFYYVYGFSGSRIQKGHSKISLCLFHPLWVLNWKELKPGS